MSPDFKTVSHFVISGFDDRDAVGVEIAHDQLAAVGFQRQADRRASYVQQCHQAVGFLVAARQSNRGDLRGARARDECLARIGQDGNLLRLLADGQSRAHAQPFCVDKRHGVVAAIADHDRRAIRRDSGQAWRGAHRHISNHLPLLEINHADAGRA